MYGSGESIIAAYIICCLANILIIPVIFIFLDTLHHVFYRIKLYRRVFDHFVERTRRKAERNVGNYGYWGVMLFVAIPLPITGAYTGTLAAWLLKLNKTKSFLYLALGVLIAGVIVSVVTVTGVEIFDIFIKERFIEKSILHTFLHLRLPA